jgi:hypothetical protein
MASPYLQVREPLQTCAPCFYTSRTSFPNPEFRYEMSMVRAMMACYILEISRVWKQWPNFQQGLGVKLPKTKRIKSLFRATSADLWIKQA